VIVSSLDSSRYLVGSIRVVTITVEVPEELVGDIYVAVGHVLQRGQDELDEATEQAAGSQRDDDDEPAGEA
jgi:hypothetical protein